MQSAYYFQKCGLPGGFRLYDISGAGAGVGTRSDGAAAWGKLVMTRGAGGVSVGGGGIFDIARLGLAAGRYRFEVTAVDGFGSESRRAYLSGELGGVIEVVVGGDGLPAVELVGVSRVRGYAAAGGAVVLEWVSAPGIAPGISPGIGGGGVLNEAAVAFEVGVGGAGGTGGGTGGGVVAVVAVVSGGTGRFRRELGLVEHGVADGDLGYFWVRSSDGVDVGAGGKRSAWVGAEGGGGAGLAVRVDAMGPGVIGVVLPRVRGC